jgi:molybdopterin synthase catalytic subunit
MAEKEIDNIIQYAKRRFDIRHIVVKHRIGKVKLGEIAFLVAVVSPHREEVFKQLSTLLTRSKEKCRSGKGKFIRMEQQSGRKE